MLIKFLLNAYTQMATFLSNRFSYVSTGRGYFCKLLNKRVIAKIQTKNKIENETVLKFQT